MNPPLPLFPVVAEPVPSLIVRSKVPPSLAGLVTLVNVTVLLFRVLVRVQDTGVSGMVKVADVVLFAGMVTPVQVKAAS
jgi:hypothetical protein